MSGRLSLDGAGQQSRVDCVKLAGRKVSTWYLRQHPKVLALPAYLAARAKTFEQAIETIKERYPDLEY